MAGINPLDERQFGRLRDSIDWSQQQFEFPRRKRFEAIKLFTGAHYAEGGSEKVMPVNMSNLIVGIYLRQLVPKAPRVMISTEQRERKFRAANFELALNQVPDEIDLAVTLRRLVMEALFSMGIARVGLHTVDKVMGFDYGQSFVDLVTLDDYYCDMAAKRFEDCQYEGHDYWLDFGKMMDSNWPDKKVRADLEPDEYTVVGPRGEDRAESIQQGGTATLFKDKIWVRDTWLSDEKLLVSHTVKGEKILKIVEWDDNPDHSPYYKLGLSDVPGNLLPLAPLAIWRDLNELGNAIFRKLADQADSQKTVLGFQGGEDDQVENFQKARDGGGIVYTGPEPKKLTAGGVQPETLLFYDKARDLSSYFAGNLDSLGGLAPLTETVGQDKLLSEAASAQMRDMADSVRKFSKDIFLALGWYEWHDPIRTRVLEKPIPGVPGMTIPVEWNRESRQSDFDLYDLKIDMYSLQDDSPSSKLQKAGMIMERYIGPMGPMIERESGVISAQKVLADVAKWSNMPEVNDWVTFIDQPQQPQAASKQGMPANTSREYVHSSRPGMTRQGASSTLQQALLGGGVQDSQAQQLANRGAV